MKIGDDLLKTTLENIKVTTLIEENYNMYKIIKVANKDLEKNNLKITLSTNHYGILEKLIKEEYGYEMLRGQKKDSCWKSMTGNENEQYSFFNLENIKENIPATKKENKKINNSETVNNVPNDNLENNVKTIMKRTDEILSEIRTLRNNRSNTIGFNIEEKNLIKTILAAYGTEVVTYKKVIIPKKLDDELNKIIFDRYMIKKDNVDYFSKVLVLAMMLLSKP